MINIAAIGSVKNWPLTAEYGLSSISYLILAALLFFLPVSLVTAELATTWPEQGGIYAWVKRAFGHRTGFLAIWLFWLLNVIWYPTILSFMAVTLAYLIESELALKPAFTTSVILFFFWGATALNLLGIRVSGWVSTLGAFCGTLIPGLCIIGAGILWWSSGQPLEMTLSILPDLSSVTHMIFFVGILLSFTGIEMSAIHAQDVITPAKTYPKAILLSGVIIVGFSLLGVLSIASIVPASELSLVAGSLQALHSFALVHNLPWLTPMMALFMLLGAFGSLSSWITATSRGLLAAAIDGDLPPKFRAMNRHGMPHRLLIAQALLVSLLTFILPFLPTLSYGFWTFSALLTQLYLIVYILLFGAALKLRLKDPLVHRPFKVPYLNIVLTLGGLSSLFAIAIGFVPPAELKTDHPWPYALSLLGGILLAISCPTLIRRCCKSR
jgi:amino acid transporter